MIDVKVIADSVSPKGIRLTTMQLEYPRFIHSEFMTHRVFSRNAASSRAIPTRKLIERIKNDPVIPKYWGRNQPGMQAEQELPPEDAEACKKIWLSALNSVLEHVELLIGFNPHKQNINRLLEPWMRIQTVVSATEWMNFFNLRDHKDAEPHIRDLAQMMKEALAFSTPNIKGEGEWHLPYVNEDMPLTDALKASTARCARVSYLLHDGRKPDLAKDISLHDRLVGSDPKHASPTEHQATPCGADFVRNFRGWKQYRVFVEGNLPVT